MPSKTVLVTGANGFLGTNLILELLKNKYEVVGLIHPKEELRIIKDLPVKLIEGDILNPGDLEKAIKGCDYVIHTAAINKIRINKYPHSWKVNFEGTKNVIKAAKKEKVKRFIHIGTANSFKFGSKKNPGSEIGIAKNSKYNLDYINSKRSAQDFILSEIEKNKFPAIIVNPTWMLGAYDVGDGSNKIILEIVKENIPGYSPGGRNYIHVKDAAVAITNAITKGRIGQCYILGNKNYTYKEIFTLIAKVAQVSPPKIYFPKIFTLAYGELLTIISKLTKKQPRISYTMAKMACDDHYFTSDKAIKELGLPQTEIETAVKDSIQWLKKIGCLH